MVLSHQPLQFETRHSWNPGIGNSPTANGNEGINFPLSKNPNPQPYGVGTAIFLILNIILGVIVNAVVWVGTSQLPFIVGAIFAKFLMLGMKVKILSKQRSLK